MSTVLEVLLLTLLPFEALSLPLPRLTYPYYLFPSRRKEMVVCKVTSSPLMPNP